MCTVSYIRRNSKTFITSNRDEHIARPSALEPKEEVINGVRVIFPKDPQAGGSWFAFNENGLVVVLLNGAFENHKRKLPYEKSRGVLLLEVVSHEQPQELLFQMDLTKIEPFTIVVNQGNVLFEFRWDGEGKHHKMLDANSDYIWSSSTLYDKQARAKRATLFQSFINSGSELEGNSILDFHSSNQQDYENGFIIDRETGLKTFSVTQVISSQLGTHMKHLDLRNQKEFNARFINENLTTAL